MADDTIVSLVHDDKLKKWDVIITGVKDEKEARQAWTAVLITLCELEPGIQHESPVEVFGETISGKIMYKLSPAVIAGSIAARRAHGHG